MSLYVIYCLCTYNIPYTSYPFNDNIFAFNFILHRLKKMEGVVNGCIFKYNQLRMLCQKRINSTTAFIPIILFIIFNFVYHN